MKKIIAFFAFAFALNMADAKTLVAYYSRTGNTATVAKMISDALNADIFEIKTADENWYPSEYQATTEQAQQEIRDGKFPPINAAPDMSEYDTVFVGTPIWWGTVSGPVHTFLTTVDLSGKTVIPFNTHAGSGRGNVHTDIATLTPNSEHKTGIAIVGSDADNAADSVNAWLREIGALK